MTRIQPIRLMSTIDKTVNWVLPSKQEARYVRRSDDYFIVYLSSHNGCNLSCRFCHLTQTGQTDFKEASVKEMMSQARLAVNHYKKMIELEPQSQVRTIHFNWMARGEALASSTLKMNWDSLSKGLKAIALQAGVEDVKFKISTIMPTSHIIKDHHFNTLTWFFNTDLKPEFYYSLYSTSERFRKKWIPKAVSPETALAVLSEWQRVTGARVALHWASIKGENDSEHDIESILEVVKKSGLKAKFNQVRYNPFDDMKSQESDEEVINKNFETISEQMELSGSRIVPRVGLDVSASCGLFINI